MFARTNPRNPRRIRYLQFQNYRLRRPVWYSHSVKTYASHMHLQNTAARQDRGVREIRHAIRTQEAIENKHPHFAKLPAEPEKPKMGFATSPGKHSIISKG